MVENLHPFRCETCENKRVVDDKENNLKWTRCTVLNGEISTHERITLVNKCGCASHSKLCRKGYVITDKQLEDIAYEVQGLQYEAKERSKCGDGSLAEGLADCSRILFDTVNQIAASPRYDPDIKQVVLLEDLKMIIGNKAMEYHKKATAATKPVDWAPLFEARDALRWLNHDVICEKLFEIRDGEKPE